MHEKPVRRVEPVGDHVEPSLAGHEIGHLTMRMASSVSKNAPVSQTAVTRGQVTASPRPSASAIARDTGKPWPGRHWRVPRYVRGPLRSQRHVPPSEEAPIAGSPLFTRCQPFPESFERPVTADCETSSMMARPPTMRSAASAEAPRTDRRVAAEAPVFDPAQIAAELQSTARHVRLPDAPPEASAGLFPGVAIAVLIPCHNEAATIAAVVRDFRAALPQARVAVFDNASKDDTIAAARAAGADVFTERRRGKGNVVRRMFAEISADIYLMVDGDGTYDASAAPQLVAMVLEDRVDMAIGVRANVQAQAHRAGHALGNRLFNRLYGALFGYAFGDIFSGYRAFSRRFVKSFPALSSGFEIETELSVHATQLRLPIGEIVLPYGKRAEGSEIETAQRPRRLAHSADLCLSPERNTAGDVLRVPAALFIFAAAILAVPLFETYVETGLVPRFPTAILCTGLVMLACMSATCGLILDLLARSRVEQKRMLYLALTQRDA